jgi:hypothetical protein
MKYFKNFKDLFKYIILCDISIKNYFQNNKKIFAFRKQIAIIISNYKICVMKLYFFWQSKLFILKIILS